MQTLLENPAPIWAVGTLATLFLVVFAWSRRSLGSMIAVATAVVATLLLVQVERAIVTPREEVEACVAEIAEAVQSDDLDAVLAMVDPAAARVRDDAQRLMEQLQIDKCHAAGTIRVELDGGEPATSALAHFKGLVNATVRQGGVRATFFDDVDLQWVRRNGTWLVANYTIYEGDRASSLGGAR